MSNAVSVVSKAIKSEEKFTDDDVTTLLTEASLDYLKSYEGDFSYLVDLRGRNPDNLTTGQIRGILNCIRADILRKNVNVDVANGRYAITIDNKLRFFKVNTPTNGKWSGVTFLEEIFGGGNRVPMPNAKFRARVLEIIANDEDALARFGRELGICGVCGRDLTDEVSRALGIGPICLEKLGG